MQLTAVLECNNGFGKSIPMHVMWLSLVVHAYNSYLNQSPWAPVLVTSSTKTVF